MPPLILKSFVKMYAMAQLASTPRIAPKKAVTPFRVIPATRKMMTALRSVTAANVMSSTFPPFSASGITSFQMTRQLKTKESRALNPVMPAKTSRSSAKSPKSRSA